MYLHEYEGKKVLWEQAETCIYSLEPQGTKLWDMLRIGCLTASRLTTFCGMSRFSDQSPEEYGLQCIGLSNKIFDSEQIERMEIGVKYEPVVRQWYSNLINHEIKEMGIGVWKQDTRFRASLDGLYDSDKGIEIKVTKNIYWPLVKYNEDFNKGIETHEKNHIWDTHYNQMIQCIHICNLKFIDYIVCGYEKNEVYIQRIYPNLDHWNMLYEKGLNFLDTYVQPLMKKHNINRIDPYILEN